MHHNAIRLLTFPGLQLCCQTTHPKVKYDSLWWEVTAPIDTYNLFLSQFALQLLGDSDCLLTGTLFEWDSFLVLCSVFFFSPKSALYLLTPHTLEKKANMSFSEKNTILIMWTLTESLSPPSVESSSSARVGSQLTEGSHMLTIKHLLVDFRDVFFVYVDNHLTDFLSDFLCICLQ